VEYRSNRGAELEKMHVGVPILASVLLYRAAVEVLRVVGMRNRLRELRLVSTSSGETRSITIEEDIL
jgi:hypothetical protein